MGGQSHQRSGTAAGHFVAQVLGVVALALVLAGLALAIFGIFWG